MEIDNAIVVKIEQDLRVSAEFGMGRRVDDLGLGRLCQRQRCHSRRARRQRVGVQVPLQ